MFRKIAYFLCLIDEEPRISLSNIAFIAILIKVMTASSVDWASLATMFLACLNLIHERHVNANTIPEVKNLSDQIQDVQNKLSPILDKVKSVL